MWQRSGRPLQPAVPRALRSIKTSSTAALVQTRSLSGPRHQCLPAVHQQGFLPRAARQPDSVTPTWMSPRRFPGHRTTACPSPKSRTSLLRQTTHTSATNPSSTNQTQKWLKQEAPATLQLRASSTTTAHSTSPKSRLTMTSTWREESEPHLPLVVTLFLVLLGRFLVSTLEQWV